MNAVSVMSLVHCPVLKEAVTPSHQVLLEQWATFCGRQLALCVTTADATRPDTIDIHVRYGTGHVGVSVRAGGDGGSDAHEPPARGDGSPDWVPRGCSDIGRREETLGALDQENPASAPMDRFEPAMEQAKAMSTRASEEQELSSSTKQTNNKEDNSVAS